VLNRGAGKSVLSTCKSFAENGPLAVSQNIH